MSIEDLATGLEKWAEKWSREIAQRTDGRTDTADPLVCWPRFGGGPHFGSFCHKIGDVLLKAYQAGEFDRLPLADLNATLRTTLRESVGPENICAAVVAWLEDRSHKFPGHAIADIRAIAEGLRAAAKSPQARKGRRGVRPPTDDQRKIATYYEESGRTQEDVADVCAKRLKRRVIQKTVSDAVKAVNRWREANPDLGLPPIATRKGRRRTTTMSNEKLDMGERTHKGLGRQTEGRRAAKEKDPSDE